VAKESRAMGVSVGFYYIGKLKRCIGFSFSIKEKSFSKKTFKLTLSFKGTLEF
jgi:hypothetical protein